MSTVIWGPSFRNDSSVLLRALKPSLYPLLANSGIQLEIIYYIEREALFGVHTVVIPSRNPGKLLSQQLEIKVGSILD